MPGDGLVPKASFTATRAITIDAPPENVWPWIVQMGYRRAGFYTYSLLDNAGYVVVELVRIDHDRTRLITRLKQRYAWESPAMALFTILLLEFGDFPMMRRALRGIKTRAARLHATEHGGRAA